MAFHYMAFRALRKENGAIGAFVELTELAIREFRNHHQVSGIDFDTYIRSASTRNGMYLHYKEWPSTLARVARSYIMQINESLERFLAEYSREHETFFRVSWRSKRQDESRLEYVLDCANQNRSVPCSSMILSATMWMFDMRPFIHPKMVSCARSSVNGPSLADHSNEIKEWFPGAGLPSAFEEIKFGDYQLFHRAVKEFAAELSEKTRPPDAVLGEVAVQATADGRPSSERTIVKAARYLQTRFGLERDASMALMRYHVTGPLVQR